MKKFSENIKLFCWYIILQTMSWVFRWWQNHLPLYLEVYFSAGQHYWHHLLVALSTPVSWTISFCGTITPVSPFDKIIHPYTFNCFFPWTNDIVFSFFYYLRWYVSTNAALPWNHASDKTSVQVIVCGNQAKTHPSIQQWLRSLAK